MTGVAEYRRRGQSGGRFQVSRALNAKVRTLPFTLKEGATGGLGAKE